MGKIVREILNENIQKYDKALEQYSDYLQGVPTFTTYFGKDIIASDQDSSLELVTEIIGIESPIKYRKIKNFIIYGIEEIKLALDEGDFGLSAGGGGTGIIPPGSIKPLPNDYFYIDYNGEEYRYKVIDVDTSKANGAAFYQITFEIASSDIDIEEQVSQTVVQQSKFDGLSHKTIVNEEDFNLLQDLRLVSKELVGFFCNYYTNNYFKIPIVDNRYDNELTQFIYNNQLLSHDNLRGIFFLPVFKVTPSRLSVYNGTLFKSLETSEISNFVRNKFFYNEDTSNTQLEYAKENILIYDYSLPQYELLKSNLKEDILTNTLRNDLMDIVTIYFNEPEKIKNIIIDYSRRLDPSQIEFNYHYIPILLFMLKRTIKQIEIEGDYGAR